MTTPQYESVAELYEDLLSFKSLQNLKAKPGFVDSATERGDDQVRGGDHVRDIGILEKYRVVSALVFTTIISNCLLAGNTWRWTTSNAVYHTITDNRATVQLVVQLVASVIGAIHVGVVCLLINYSTRLRLASSRISLQLLHFWSQILAQRLDWDMSFHLLALSLLFLASCMIPSALWAAAITPINISAIQYGTTLLPSWQNITLLHQDYTNRSGLPLLQTLDGIFAFSVGETFNGVFIASASSATTLEGSLRKHQKQDLTGFTYHGRSYGAGSTVGLKLISHDKGHNPLAKSYSYLESGYIPSVKCIYNSSSVYSISSTQYGNETMLFSVNGFLPNSNGVQEWARYASYSADAILSIGVASSPDSEGRILSIAAGKNYANLNSTQCTINFQPTIFNVSVDNMSRDIKVTPFSDRKIADIDPTGFLTFVANWQFSLISSDQSRLYSSAIGDAFSQSINNYISSAEIANGTRLTLSEATLPGLQNSIEAMIDDILVAYSSAQVVVGNQTSTVDAILLVDAFQLGSRGYIIAVVVLNVLIIAAFVFEGVRTRSWRGLAPCDFMSLKNVFLGVERVKESSSEERSGGELSDLDKDPKEKVSSCNVATKKRAYVKQVGNSFVLSYLGDDDHRGPPIHKRKRRIWV